MAPRLIVGGWGKVTELAGGAGGRMRADSTDTYFKVRLYLTPSLFQVILQKSIPTQIRQLIL